MFANGVHRVQAQRFRSSWKSEGATTTMSNSGVVRVMNNADLQCVDCEEDKPGTHSEHEVGSSS